jgi:NAD(P) transhydrogenase subunit alpha
MRVCVPKEAAPTEKRVATTPEAVRSLIELGFEVSIEAGAGRSAGFLDAVYEESGAIINSNTRQLWDEADVLLKVRAPLLGGPTDEVNWLHSGQTLIGFLWPAQNQTLLERLAKNGVNALSIDAVPRISRAQNLDALSSMANIAGYRAVVEAANHFGRFFTGQVTAAGKVPPVKLLVIGAGVAGLAAIGTAGSMGAVVKAFDTRPEVKEQVNSMGAEFLFLDFEENADGSGGYARVMSDEFIQAEMNLFSKQAREVDIIITTALIPGKPAPKLITEEMVRSMKPGSVIVDLAAEQGGNCDLTVMDKVVSDSDVTIIGYSDLPSRMAAQSSQLYGNNLRNLLTELCPKRDGNIELNMQDVVIRAMTVVHDGQISWPPPDIQKDPAVDQKAHNPASEQKKPLEERSAPNKVNRTIITFLGMGAGLLAILGVGAVTPPSFMAHFIVFILAIFVGWQVIWNVTPALHTPLMSVTNAISGIIVIGALLQTSSSSNIVLGLAAFSILIASINISGGFLVTQRMLRMFRRE